MKAYLGAGYGCDCRDRHQVVESAAEQMRQLKSPELAEYFRQHGTAWE